MKRPRWRLSALLFAGSAALVVPLLILVERVAEGAVRRAADLGSGSIEEILGDLRVVLVVVVLVALAGATVMASVLGRRVAGQLRRLRTETAVRARGERAPVTKQGLPEIRGVAGAVELLADELERRCDALVSERDELARLLDSVSEGILQVDRNGRIVHSNPAARAALGMRGGGVGQPVDALVRHAQLRDVIRRAASGEVVGAVEITLDEQRLLVAARPSGQHGRSPAGAVVAFTNLTEIRRLESVRRDFVANVSHELKTPLTSIRGYVETLLNDDLPEPMHRQFLEVIQQNAKRLHGIVDDLLDLSRLESGGWRPELQDIDPLELAVDVWGSLSERSGPKRIEFTTVGARDRVRADPAGLRQVLSNLLDNAIRHTPDGGRITVRAIPTTEEADPGSRRIRIDVQDTGSGIPREALPRVFERFYRVDPARSRAEGGTGLGLSIVKHLVESMGGDVAAESELNKGTNIRVHLPAS